MESRKKSKKLAFKGIFEGAKVVRGIDWLYDGDQDGVSCSYSEDENKARHCSGKVTQIKVMFLSKLISYSLIINCT